MGYKESIPRKISALGSRVDDRLALWQAIAQAFESDGAEGVAEELKKRMENTGERFNAALAKLEAML